MYFLHFLFRAVEDEILFTYDAGRSALASLEMNGRQVRTSKCLHVLCLISYLSR